MKSVMEQGFFQEFVFDKKTKHLSNIKSVENVRSSNVIKFELCHIPKSKAAV